MRKPIIFCVLIMSFKVSTPAFLIADSPLLLKISAHQTRFTPNDTIKLSAAVYDYNNVRIFSIEENDTCFSWSVTGSYFVEKSPVFVDSTGADCSLISSDTGSLRCKVICQFHYLTCYLSDTIEMIIIPHMNEYNMFIEADSSLKSSPNKAVPIPAIAVTSFDTIHVYAVIRDCFGNYVRLANHCRWDASDDIIRIETKQDNSGEACNSNC